MRTKLFSTAGLFCAVVFCLLLTGMSARAASGDLKLEAQLVLGSDDVKPKNGLKPVASDIEKKLKQLPLKWNHYYIMSEKNFTVAKGDTKKTDLSKQCQVSVKNLGDQRVELTLASKGQNIGNITQSLHKGQTLVVGGDADNTIVVLWQAD